MKKDFMRIMKKGLERQVHYKGNSSIFTQFLNQIIKQCSSALLDLIAWYFLYLLQYLS